MEIVIIYSSNYLLENPNDKTISKRKNFIIEQGLKFLGLKHKEFILKKGAYGKPYIESGPKFNISHSQKFIVAAFHLNLEIGIDTEEIVYYKNTTDHHFLSPSEKISIINSSSPSKSFIQLWTKKESVMKAEGRGNQINARDIKLGTNEANYKGRKWFLYNLTLCENQVTTLATPYPVGRIHVKKLAF